MNASYRSGEQQVVVSFSQVKVTRKNQSRAIYLEASDDMLRLASRGKSRQGRTRMLLISNISNRCENLQSARVRSSSLLIVTFSLWLISVIRRSRCRCYFVRDHWSHKNPQVVFCVIYFRRLRAFLTFARVVL